MYPKPIPPCFAERIFVFITNYWLASCLLHWKWVNIAVSFFSGNNLSHFDATSIIVRSVPREPPVEFHEGTAFGIIFSDSSVFTVPVMDAGAIFFVTIIFCCWRWVPEA
jgi:hypothetical protein